MVSPVAVRLLFGRLVPVVLSMLRLRVVVVPTDRAETAHDHEMWSCGRWLMTLRTAGSHISC